VNSLHDLTQTILHQTHVNSLHDLTQTILHPFAASDCAT